MSDLAPTLTDFLLARIAEDEAFAVGAASFTPWDRTFERDDYGCLRVQPVRVLAECEAKRRIVEWVAGAQAAAGDPPGFDVEDAAALTFALDHLAAVYADHPDYREEWRP